MLTKTDNALLFKAILCVGAAFLLFTYCRSAYDYNQLQKDYRVYKERTDNRINEMSGIVDAYYVQQSKLSFVKKETECLAKNIYFEAGSEPIEGKIAVAQVTKNRVKSGKFPSTYCGVIYQKVDNKCQFSWTCDGKNDTIKAPSLYKSALKIAQDFLIRNKKSAIIDNNVYFYHASYVQPKWSNNLAHVTTIGTHEFYKYGN